LQAGLEANGPTPTIYSRSVVRNVSSVRSKTRTGLKLPGSASAVRIYPFGLLLGS
jgi:hypothetical protein